MLEWTVRSEYAFVKVERLKQKGYVYRVIQDKNEPILYCKPGTRVFSLLDERPNAKIIDNEGNILQPSGRFLMTVETIDPYHLLADYMGGGAIT